MRGLISILVPVYNHQQALTEALASIEKQTYKNFEVIVVDDGSDEPISLKTSNYNLQVIRQENRGAPAARNRGLSEAKGDYVIFWDADVVAEPEMLEKMQNVLNIHPEASYVYCDWYYGSKKMPAKKFDPEALKQNNYIHSTSLIKKDDCPHWDESLKRFQDWDLWLTMFQNKKIGIYIPEFLFKAIPHKGGMSNWLPSIFYKKPFKWLPGISSKVKQYEEKFKIVQTKHNLS